jgi:hypothetical protein
MDNPGDWEKTVMLNSVITKNRRHFMLEILFKGIPVHTDNYTVYWVLTIVAVNPVFS